MTPLSEQVERPACIRECLEAARIDHAGCATDEPFRRALNELDEVEAVLSLLSGRSAAADTMLRRLKADQGHLTEQGKRHLETMLPGSRVLSAEEVEELRGENKTLLEALRTFSNLLAAMDEEMPGRAEWERLREPVWEALAHAAWVYEQTKSTLSILDGTPGSMHGGDTARDEAHRRWEEDEFGTPEAGNG